MEISKGLIREIFEKNSKNVTTFVMFTGIKETRISPTNMRDLA